MIAKPYGTTKVRLFQLFEAPFCGLLRKPELGSADASYAISMNTIYFHVNPLSCGYCPGEMALECVGLSLK
jgi:hypothetical protein